MRKAYEIRNVFPSDKISALHRIFDNTDEDVLVKTSHMARCVNQMKGNPKEGFTSFSSLVTKNEYDPSQERILASFYTENNANLNSLNLITSDSKAACKEFITGRLNEIHNVEVVSIHPAGVYKKNTSC